MGKNQNNIELNKTMLAIIVALSGRVLHGYAIVKQIKSNAGYEIPIATLYRNIAKLEKAKLIKETTPLRKDENDDPRRKYYTVTALGERAADAEFAMLDSLAAARGVSAS